MMKRTFTRFWAALALLVFMAPSMVMWGQTRATVTDELTQSWTGVSGTNYLNWSGKTNNSDAVWAGNSAGGNNSIQLRSNNNNSGIITTTSGGTIKSVSVDWNSNTSNGRTLNVYGKNSAYSSPSNLYNDNDQGTLLGTIVKGTSTSLTISGSYEYIGMRSASGAMYLTKIYVEWETGGGGGSTDPTIFFDSQSANLGIKGVGEEFTTSFTVSQTNLTGDITLTLEGQGELGTTSIEQGADPTEVTWTYTPNEAININTTITATSEGAEPVTFTITGEAKAYHTVIIAPGMANGAITADPTQAYEGQYVTLTIVPATGYELEELTVVDGDDNEIEVDNLYRFQMPDSDVTVSATFVEAAPTTTDVLNWVATGSPTNYTDWTYTGSSGTEYAGQSSGTYQSIQLRSNNNNSGIVSTTSSGNVKKVTVSWNSNTQNGRTLNIYGKNTAYSAASDLYGNNAGDLLGTIVCGTSNELAISDNYAYVGLRSASGAMYLNEIDIDWAVSGTPAPSISADPVEIAYNVTSGSIMYEIENYVAGTMVATTSADWISDFTYEQVDEIGEVGFTATVNPTGIARTATVTLTYTYGDSQTATKNVTVTQTGNPNVVDNISDITEVGVQYAVRGTVVATNSRGFIIGDGTGYVYTYLNAAPTQSVGDIVSISGTTGQYGHIIQFTSSATIAEATESNYNGEPEYTVITEVPDYSEGYHLSDYFQFEGTLSKAINNNYTNYNIAVGEGTIRISYPTDDQVTALEDLLDKTVRVHGFFAGISGTTFTAMMESIEEVVAAEPTITLISNDPTFTPESPYMIEFTHESGGGSSIDQVQCENFSSPLTEDDFSILFCDAEGNELTNQTAPDWILDAPSVTSESNNLYLGVTVDVNQSATARTCYFKVGAANGTDMVYSDLVTVYQAGFAATITVDPTVVNATAAETDGTLTVAYENINTVQYGADIYWFEDAEGMVALAEAPSWILADFATNDINTIEYTIEANAGEARTAYFKVYGVDIYNNDAYSDMITINQAEYVAPVEEENYALFTGDLVEGDYLIVYDGRAMNNVVDNNSRLQYEEVSAVENVITTDNASIIWHIAPYGEYWTLYSADAEAYAAGTGVKNKAQMLEDGTDDKALWTAEATAPSEAFDFINKYNANHNVNSYLRNNGNFGFACYGTGTGGALSLYKKVDNTPSITLDTYLVEATAAANQGTITVTCANMGDEPELEVIFYEADGEAEATYSWIDADIDNDNNVYYVIDANEGEARTAYFKVYGLDGEAQDVYSNLVTVTQEAAPQQYDLTVEAFENLELITFVNDEMIMETEGTIQVTEGAQVMLSIVANEGYVIETLMVNGVNHAADIAEDFTYTFEMPAEAVTISATAVEAPTPVGGDYVRITSLDQLTDGSKVVIAARYDEELTNGYYAMNNTLTSGKAQGVEFTSTTSENDEILPASIVENEDDYYWTVNVTEDGYTFTNANGDMIGYGSSGTNFVIGGTKTVWTIEEGVSDQAALVSEYTGFVIKNKTTNTRAFAYSNTEVFGAYATSNMTGNNASTYNFCLDFFVQGVETETYTLEIAGYGDSEGGYYLIASPVASDVRPSAENGFLTDAYDLYWFDQTQDEEWRNYEAGEFDLVSGMGYLYASQEGTTLTFTGTPYDGDGSVSLVKDDEAQLKGWNLVGNPFGVPAYIDRDFYKMNPQTGAELIQSSGEIAVMQGIFVIANEDGENLTFTPEATDQSANLTLNLSQSRGAVIDRAIVRFGEGRQLPKFQLNPNSTKVYIPQGAEDFAVVRSNAQGEMPVNFKAQNNGTYTISINTENLEANYLHLIDNMTGTNIDLLQTPSYTFEAKTTDYASRFRLVFNVTGVEENTTSTEPFAFFNGSEWVVSNIGEATLQVVDMMGRVLRSEHISGNAAVNINETAGIYMLRLVNGENIMVQKVVVR